jgi:hypothetical protein
MGDISSGMPRAPSENTTQIVVRIPEAWVKRADALIPTLGRPGVAVTRTDAIRAAIAEGLDSLEARAKPKKK